MLTSHIRETGRRRGGEGTQGIHTYLVRHHKAGFRLSRNDEVSKIPVVVLDIALASRK